MKEPDRTGRAGRAWIVPKLDPPARPDHAASIKSFVLEVPGAHPLWSWFVAEVISLRDIPGVKPANKKYDGAEHELYIVALDPKQDIDVDNLPPKDGWHILSPLDCQFQFHGVGDVGASWLLRTTVQAIVRGDITPDSDRRSHFEGMLATTLDHYKRGLHPTA